MGHRHMINTSDIFETENDQIWNQAEQTLMPIARAGASESSSHIHPLANTNTSIQGGHYPSHWNHASSSSGYSSSIHNVELPVYQQQAPGPSHDHFLCQPAAVNFHMFPDNYSYYPSSSDLGGQPTPGPDGGFYDHSTGSFRGPYKRKTPGIPPCDRGSTSSRCFDVGSSSNLHLPSDPWQEKHNTESHHAPHEYHPSYRAHNLPIGNEGMLRNVRSRAAVDLETNMTRTHLSSNPLHYPFSSRSSDQSNSADFWGNAPTRELNRSLISPNDHGLTYGPDSSFFGHGPNSVCAQSTHQSGSLENSVYRNDLMSNRNPAPQNVHVNSDQPGRDARSGYGPRTIPTFRTSSSNLHHGHVAASDEGLHMVSERYPSRDPRPFSTIRWRNIDRNRRNLTSSDRYRSFTEDVNSHDRLTPEGVMLDYSSFYGSRTLFDQHRDMRLDIDNMSYEELLALGERIGNVNTGLSDDLISESVTEFIYGSSDLSQDEGTCVICLEEYKNMDDVGTLKVCCHDFHVGCIKKWLSMKNSCPICKSSALDDSKEN